VSGTFSALNKTIWVICRVCGVLLLVAVLLTGCFVWTHPPPPSAAEAGRKRCQEPIRVENKWDKEKVSGTFDSSEAGYVVVPMYVRKKKRGHRKLTSFAIPP